MMTADEVLVARFHTALAASARSKEIPESVDAYGWLVGSWELDVRRYWAVDVSAQHIKGEVHASWVLEGRAVQDLWIMPRMGDRSAALDKRLNMFGTTLRAWDPSIKAWRITWSNPAGEHFENQAGDIGPSSNSARFVGRSADHYGGAITSECFLDQCNRLHTSYGFASMGSDRFSCSFGRGFTCAPASQTILGGLGRMCLRGAIAACARLHDDRLPNLWIYL